MNTLKHFQEEKEKKKKILPCVYPLGKKNALLSIPKNSNNKGNTRGKASLVSTVARKNFFLLFLVLQVFKP